MSDQVEVPMDKLARVYRKIRAQIQEMDRAHEAAVAVLKEKQAAVANAMKEEMQRLNLKSVRTVEGTVMLTEKVRYYATDWESFGAFVLEQGNIDLLEHRIAQKNMATYLADNPEAVPPGLNSDTELTVIVRKPSV